MRWLAVFVLLWSTSAVAAGECTSERFEGKRFSWCLVDLAREELRLWLYDADGLPFGSFNRLNESLAEQGQSLGLAMNGGMYHQDRAPVGHYVEDGKQEVRVITNEGPGNFGLLPNGVLCLRDHLAQVLESRAFVQLDPACTHATQSGPMLVISGDLHPRFIPNSDSLHVRNGIGVRANGQEVLLAISDDPVNFHQFARFFRDVLGTPDALFLDGTVSKLFAPPLDRNDFGLPMGPILGTVEPNG